MWPKYVAYNLTKYDRWIMWVSEWVKNVKRLLYGCYDLWLVRSYAFLSLSFYLTHSFYIQCKVIILKILSQTRTLNYYYFINCLEHFNESKLIKYYACQTSLWTQPSLLVWPICHKLLKNLLGQRWTPMYYIIVASHVRINMI